MPRLRAVLLQCFRAGPPYMTRRKTESGLTSIKFPPGTGLFASYAPSMQSLDENFIPQKTHYSVSTSPSQIIFKCNSSNLPSSRYFSRNRKHHDFRASSVRLDHHVQGLDKYLCNLCEHELDLDLLHQHRLSGLAKPSALAQLGLVLRIFLPHA